MKTTAILLRSPRVFPLSVWATFKRKIQIFTHKFTPLSIPLSMKDQKSISEEPFGNRYGCKSNGAKMGATNHVLQG